MSSFVEETMGNHLTWIANIQQLHTVAEKKIRHLVCDSPKSWTTRFGAGRRKLFLTPFNPDLRPEVKAQPC